MKRLKIKNMLTKKDVKKLNNNVFNLIGNEWMLITAGNLKSMNTMTASWGGMGVLWNKDVAIIYIRPQRYTLNFVQKHDIFTLSFFDSAHKDILRFCGAKSGKNIDKIAATGLEPFEMENKGIAFKQSKLVIECKKIYVDQIKEDKILDTSISISIYPEKDFHYIFIGEILSCLTEN